MRRGNTDISPVPGLICNDLAGTHLLGHDQRDSVWQHVLFVDILQQLAETPGDVAQPSQVTLVPDMHAVLFPQGQGVAPEMIGRVGFPVGIQGRVRVEPEEFGRALDQLPFLCRELGSEVFDRFGVVPEVDRVGVPAQTLVESSLSGLLGCFGVVDRFTPVAVLPRMNQ